MKTMVEFVAPFIFLLISNTIHSYAQQTCSTYSFSTNKAYTSCNDLPFLNSFLHWNYNSSKGNLEIAFRQTGITSSQWAAWAINPTSTGMVGSQALVAYPASDGAVKAYTSHIDAYRTSMEEGKLSFGVSGLSATYAKNEIVIYATLDVSKLGKSEINQVWQQGPVSSGKPAMHPTLSPNVQSMGTINLLSGSAAGGGGANDKLAMRNTHGILNAVSWGVMMPIGALTARYLKAIKPGNPTWFYLHISCQSAAYIIGVAGWGTGLKLGSESAGVQHTAHRNIGITLFVFATLQVFALLLRPKPDHKYRPFWNIYHQSIGYSTIILSIINILKGLNILKPDHKWKDSYIGIVVVLAVSAVFLEGFTWYLAKRKKSYEKFSQGFNSAA